MSEDVMRQAYRELTVEDQKNVRLIKVAGANFIEILDGVSLGSREISLAKTKTEEAVMWAVKHVTG